MGGNNRSCEDSALTCDTTGASEASVPASCKAFRVTFRGVGVRGEGAGGGREGGRALPWPLGFARAGCPFELLVTERRQERAGCPGAASLREASKEAVTRRQLVSASWQRASPSGLAVWRRPGLAADQSRAATSRGMCDVTTPSRDAQGEDAGAAPLGVGEGECGGRCGRDDSPEGERRRGAPGHVGGAARRRRRGGRRPAVEPLPQGELPPPPPPGSIFSGTSGTDVGVIDLVQGRPKGVITLVRNHRYRGIVTSRYQLEPVFCRHIWVCHSCCSCRVCVCEWRCVCVCTCICINVHLSHTSAIDRMHTCSQ